MGVGLLESLEVLLACLAWFDVIFPQNEVSVHELLSPFRRSSNHIVTFSTLVSTFSSFASSCMFHSCMAAASSSFANFTTYV